MTEVPPLVHRCSSRPHRYNMIFHGDHVCVRIGDHIRALAPRGAVHARNALAHRAFKGCAAFPGREHGIAVAGGTTPLLQLFPNGSRDLLTRTVEA
jgi:hypothetical protein